MSDKLVSELVVVSVEDVLLVAPPPQATNKMAKDKVNKIDVVQNNHSGSEEKHKDYIKQFQSTQLDTLNLGIGVAALIYLIYRARNINI